MDTASTLSLLCKDRLKPDTSIITEFSTEIGGIADKTIQSLGIVTAAFQIKRKTNFIVFDILERSEMELESFDGLVGLNILEDSNIDLTHNLVTLKDNEEKIAIKPEKPKAQRKMSVSKKKAKVLKVELPKPEEPSRAEKLLEHIDLSNHDEETAQELKRIITKNSESFYVEGDSMKYTNLYTYTIRLSDHTPSFIKQFPIKPQLLPFLEKELEQMINDGIIEPCLGSNYNSPVFIVRKSQPNTWRLVLDYRALNTKIFNEFHGLPHIDTIIQRLKKNAFYSTIDVRQAYYNIALSESSRPLTAFTVPTNKFGHSRFMYRKLPMGFVNSSYIWIKAVETVLRPFLNDRLFVYVDDCILIAQTKAQALKILDEVLDTLIQYGIKVDPKKSTFVAQELEFLGHRVCAKGHGPTQQKTDLINNYPPPSTVKQVKAFIGLANFYAKYVPEFGTIAIPLYELTKKGNRFRWSAEAHQAFEKIKKAIAEAPTLAFINPEKTLIVTTDASRLGIAAVLSQLDEENNEVPIAFASRKLTHIESAQSSFDRELMAIVFALTKAFKKFCYGRKTLVRCDNKGVVYLLNARLESCTDRVIRARLKLADHDFRIIHQLGKSERHFLADLISRINFESDETLTHDKSLAKVFAITRKQTRATDESFDLEYAEFTKTVDVTKNPKNVKISNQKINMEDASTYKILAVTASQPSFPECMKSFLSKLAKKHIFRENTVLAEGDVITIIYKLDQSQVTDVNNLFRLLAQARQEFRNKGGSKNIHFAYGEDPKIPSSTTLQLLGFIFRNDATKVTMFLNEAMEITDEVEMVEIIKSFHVSSDLLHRGVESTYDILKKSYRFPNLKALVQQVLAKCDSCQRTKREPRRSRIPLRLVSTSEHFFDKLYIDTIGKFNRTEDNLEYALSVIDELTRWLFIIPIPDITAETLASALLQEVFIKFATTCRIIVSDNHQSFNSKLFKQLSSLIQAPHLKISVHAPAGNLVETVHFTVKQMAKPYLNKELDNWPDMLRISCALYNQSKHEALKVSPFEALFGRQPRKFQLGNSKEAPEYLYDDFISRTKSNIRLAEKLARENSQLAKEKHKAIYDKKFKTQELIVNVGDNVLVKAHHKNQIRLKESYLGPFPVISVAPQYVVIINKDKRPQSIHKNQIKIYKQ